MEMDQILVVGRCPFASSLIYIFLSPTVLYGKWPQIGLLGGGKLMVCTPFNARHPTLKIVVMIPLRVEGV